MRVTKSSLTARTKVIEDLLIKAGKHPGDEYKLYLDHAACYGGYKFTCEHVKTGQQGLELNNLLSQTRRSASDMESYQQGIIDALRMMLG